MRISFLSLLAPANHSRASGAQRFVATLLVGIVTLQLASPAFAFDPEWQWKVQGFSNTFPTKTLAVDFMHAQSATLAKLTVETGSSTR